MFKILLPAALSCLAMLSEASAAGRQRPHTCASQREAQRPLKQTLRLQAPAGQAELEVELSCTNWNNIVNVTLRERETGHELQGFNEEQSESYLEASVPDLDDDGYSDLVMVVWPRGPDARFNAWRFDPVERQFRPVFLERGFEFYRTQHGEVITKHTAADGTWTKTLHQWQNGKLIPTYAITRSIVGRCDVSFIRLVRNLPRYHATRVEDAPDHVRAICSADAADEPRTVFLE